MTEYTVFTLVFTQPMNTSEYTCIHGHHPCIQHLGSHTAAGDGVLSDTVRHDLTQARVKLAVIAALSFAGQLRRFSDKGLLLTEVLCLATT